MGGDIRLLTERGHRSTVPRSRYLATWWRSPISDSGKAELHAHTTFSDGVLSPRQLVEEAQCVGLTALAVTDHDIVDGVAPARAAARDLEVELDLAIIAGVEFSTNLHGHEIHVLGLFIDDDNAELIASTVRSREFRTQRAEEIVERLNQLGHQVDFRTVEAAADKGSIGRPHIARALVQHGVATTPDQAFRRLIGIGKPTFVPKPTLEVTEVIGVVHGAGGVAILAHPASTRVGEGQIRELATLGLDGFEIQHPKHGPSARRKLTALIDDLGLLPSGGSDFHGPGSGRTKLGAHAVPLQTMEALRSASLTYRNAQAPTEETE